MFQRRRNGPTTIVGRFLRAAALRQDASKRDPLRAELRRTGWYDADSVACAAFELTVREAYGPGVQAVDVPDMIAGMRRFFGSDGVDRIPQREAELLIRAALGEDALRTEIPVGTSFLVHGLIFVGLVVDMNYSEVEIDNVLVTAEGIARERGFAPTLA